MSWEDFLSYLNEVLNFTLFQLKDTPVTVLSFIMFILFITVFVVIAIAVRKALNRKILRRFKIDKGTAYTLSRITQYTIITIGALISFQFVGIDLSGLAVIFGLLSVGIGFGLQNITANFISGLIILFERPISVGDRVKVNEIEGDVQEINIRSTKIRTLNNVHIIVPNSEFVSKDVINYSYGDPTFRLDIDVGVSYKSDLEKVLKCLDEVAKENSELMKSPKHRVHLTAFGDSAWHMQLRVWISDVTEHPKIRNELNQAIVQKFRENDVEIPFPQRDLHIRSSVSLPVSGSGNGGLQ